VNEMTIEHESVAESAGAHAACPHVHYNRCSTIYSHAKMHPVIRSCSVAVRRLAPSQLASELSGCGHVS
jgi:hypothetical protein